MIHCWASYTPKLSVHFASGYSAASTDTLSYKIDWFALKTLPCLVSSLFFKAFTCSFLVQANSGLLYSGSTLRV